MNRRFPAENGKSRYDFVVLRSNIVICAVDLPVLAVENGRTYEFQLQIIPVA